MSERRPWAQSLWGAGGVGAASGWDGNQMGLSAPQGPPAKGLRLIKAEASPEWPFCGSKALGWKSS